MIASIPLLVAHRGHPALYPENTLAGIEAALRCGACWIEFDVQISADGVPFVIHDATLERTSESGISVLETSAAQLTTISVHEPARFGSKYQPTRLPTLAQALALIEGWPRTQVFVEIKEETLVRFGLDASLRALIEVVRAHTVSCTLISYAAEILAPARAAGYATGWVLGRWDSASQHRAALEAPDFLICNHKRLPLSIQEIWQGPWRWVCYEVSDPEVALTLATRGVELVESDAIGAMLEHPLLHTRNCLGA